MRPVSYRMFLAAFTLTVAIFGSVKALVSQSKPPAAQKPLEIKAPSIAPTPPMGWNSWNHFAGKINDATVRAQADAMVSSGMRDAGYQYINIDDTWEGQRDAQGIIHSNEKFPDMKALADYVHSKGLKIGIYSSPGPKTCAGFSCSTGVLGSRRASRLRSYHAISGMR